MRIVGGEFGGRTLFAPKSPALRPTQDRVREALFSILQCELPGSAFLDLFAGTGAVGLEALSRGAATATFVEASAHHLESLRRNVAAMVAQTSRANIADPPYALGEEKGYASVLAMLAGRGVVKPGGLFVAEMTAVQRAEDTPGWDLLRDRTYGKTRICIWRNAANAKAL